MPRLRTVSTQMPGWTRLPHGRGFRYLDEQRPSPRRLRRRPGQGAGHPAGLARGVDLAVPQRPPAGGRHRRGRTPAVPLPRRVATQAGRGEVRPRHRDGRPAAPRAQDASAPTSPTPPPRARPRWPPRCGSSTSGCFRLGSDSSVEEHGSYGLTTLERRHVRRRDGGWTFSFVGKAGVEHDIDVRDPDLCKVLELLAGRRRGDARLLCHQMNRRWVPLQAGDVNDHIRELFGLEVTRQGLPHLARHRARRRRARTQHRHHQDRHARRRCAPRWSAPASCWATPRRCARAPTSTRGCSTSTSTT